MSKRVKIFAIIVLVIAVIVWIGGRSGEPTAADSPLESTGALEPYTTQEDPRENEFAALLSTVSSISIDTSVFATPAYKALRDNPITLGTDVIGRPNPFAPLGSDSAGDQSVPIVQTLQPGKVTSMSAEFSAQVSFTTTAPVSVIFEYGTTDQYGSATSPVVLNKSGTVLVTARDLQPETTYRVRAVAVVGSTTTTGNAMSFATTSALTP